MHSNFQRYGFIAAATTVTMMSIATSQASAEDSPYCSASTRDASVVYAAPAEMPFSASAQFAGKADVRVDLLATGEIASVAIANSSGNALLDAAALRAAKASQFQSEVRDCRTIEGSYLFVVSFDR